MKQLKLHHKMAAAMTAGLMVSGGSAFAGDNLSNMSTNVITSASKLPNMIQTVAYIGGIGLGVAGVFKLKQHVDSPGQHAMKDGLIRLGAGGGLLMLPYLTEVMSGSIAAGSAGTAPTAAAFTGVTALQ